MEKAVRLTEGKGLGRILERANGAYYVRKLGVRESSLVIRVARGNVVYVVRKQNNVSPFKIHRLDYLSIKFFKRISVLKLAFS